MFFWQRQRKTIRLCLFKMYSCTYPKVACEKNPPKRMAPKWSPSKKAEWVLLVASWPSLSRFSHRWAVDQFGVSGIFPPFVFQCREVKQQNVSKRCSFIQNNPDCKMDGGFLNYLNGAFCAFPADLQPLAVTLYVRIEMGALRVGWIPSVFPSG